MYVYCRLYPHFAKTISYYVKLWTGTWGGLTISGPKKTQLALEEAVVPSSADQSQSVAQMCFSCVHHKVTPFSAPYGHLTLHLSIVWVVRFKSFPSSSKEQQNPQAEHTSSGVILRCLYGHLISRNPNGELVHDGSYTAPSGEAPTYGWVWHT
jgi:hypothetical protein